MTAEIVIMNKEAVAIAADSAITVSRGEGQKIITSANKIFALSKFQPVGIMVYGNADFMSIPWESIIKMYRKHLGKGSFANLGQYAADFIRFLENDRNLFPKHVQEDHIKASIRGYFSLIKREILEEADLKLKERSEITFDKLKSITQMIVEKHHVYQKGAPNAEFMDKSSFELFQKKYNGVISVIREEIFEKLPIGHDDILKLSDIAVYLFTKFPMGSYQPYNVSGVVITGFGEKDIFPVLQSYAFECIINNHLKYLVTKDLKIGNGIDQAIMPFAQSEMVFTFMEGVDPEYEAALEADIREICAKMRREDVDNYLARLKDYRRTTHIDPVLQVVSILPKSELAAMAESLVNLTSFKRKVTMVAETVGGPIDVAVISRGDGFIWIKRKHYFRPELNPQFFDSCVGGVQDGN